MINITRTIKIRVYPNKTQEDIINQTLGACRFVYNKFIAYNKQQYELYGEYTTAYEFSKILTILKRDDKDYEWLNDISRKAYINAVINAHKTYRKFFKGDIPRTPTFKSKRDLIQSYFFIKNQVRQKHNKIQVPMLGWLRTTDNKPIPNNISSGRIIKSHNKYYISLIYDKEHNTDYEDDEYEYKGMGIDVGVKTYLTIYTEDMDNEVRVFRKSNINKSEEVIRLEKKLIKFNKIISNKIEINKKKLKMKGKQENEEQNEETKKSNERRVYYTSNIKRIRNKVIRCNERLNNIRKDYIDKICNTLVKAKPEYITIEDLSVSNMLQEGQTKLADNIAKCKFFYFRTQLTSKCEEYNIELRIADNKFASSKICSCCGNKKKTLSLSDRTYVCDNCGIKLDRDLNASINLYNLDKYKVQ